MGTRIREAIRLTRENFHLLSWVSHVVKQFKFYLAGILLLNIVQMLMGVFFSVFVKHLIDRAYNAEMTGLLVLYAVLLTGWTVLGGFLGYVTSMYYVNITFSVRKKVYEAVLKAQMLKLSAMPVGDLNTRISTDSAEIADFACKVFPTVVGALIQLIVTAFIVYRVNSSILLILLASGVVSAVLMLVMRMKLKPLLERLRQANVDETSFQTELCNNLPVVKSLCREPAQAARLERLHDNAVDALRKKNRFYYLSDTGLDVFFNAGYLLVFCWAILHLRGGAVTYGTLSMLIALEGYIQGPISSFTGALPAFVHTLVSAGKLDEVMRFDACEESDDALPMEGEAFRVTVRDLAFSYPDRDERVLSGFSCDILPGQTAVIAGPSGCGKTTLLNLLMHMMSPQEGTIEFTSPSGQTMPASRAVRRRMGYVPQGNTLFSGTILDNVCFGVDNADEEKAREALRIADALSFVEAMPQGLRSVINENNGGLSAGQAQRVSIARALMIDPAVLILDEATSALDRDSEDRILSAISAMPRHPTVLCVSHREAAFRYADQIIRLEPEQAQ